MNIYSMLSPEEQSAIRGFVPKARKKSLRASLRDLGVRRIRIHYPTGTVRALLSAWMEPEDIRTLSAALHNGKYTITENVMEVTA